MTFTGEQRAGVGLCPQEPQQLVKLRRRAHTADLAGFIGLDFRTLRDHICNGQGPEVDFVRQVDFYR